MSIGIVKKLLFVLVAAVCVGCDQQTPQAAGPPPARDVEIVQVEVKDIPVVFDFVGRTASSQRVEIRARVAGFLDEIAYQEGEFVEMGQELFQIDPAPFESALRAARAELTEHQARLENAESLLARVKPLAEADAVSDKELDDANDAVRSAAASVEAASARVFDAELNLGYTTITSPVRGLTGESVEREGAYISGVSGALTYVARIDPIWVEFSVTEMQALEGQSAESAGLIRNVNPEEWDVKISLADGREHPYSGRISFADASVSTQTGSMLVRAEMPNPEETLRPGQFVSVSLHGAVRPDAVVVPLRAVREGPKGPYLWVINNQGQAEQRPVTLGPWHDAYWVIEQGLDVGDRVIVNGTVGLRPGFPVNVGRIIPPGEAMSAPAEGNPTP